MSVYLIIILSILGGAITGNLITRIFTPAKTLPEQRALDYYEESYLSKQGWTSFYGDKKGTNYNLKSFDGGKNWYVVEYNFDLKELKVLGGVEDIYPGLMENLTDWEELKKHVKKNGSIGSSGKFSVEDKKVMKKVGLEIINN